MYKHDNTLNPREDKDPIAPAPHCPHCSEDTNTTSADYGYSHSEKSVISGTPDHKGEQEYFPDLHEDSDNVADDSGQDCNYKTDNAQDCDYTDSGIGENTDFSDLDDENASYE